MTNLLALLSTFLLLTQQPPAPTPSTEEVGKARIKAALDATKFSYIPTSSGLNYSILFDHPNKRQQQVFVSLKPASVGTAQTHFIYTTVWVGTNPPDDALLRSVLLKSKKFGYFYLFKDSKGTWAIRFGAHFDATDIKDMAGTGDPLVKNLKDTIFFVNVVGEETDKEINGEKDIKG
jgi:hypothetical protein